MSKSDRQQLTFTGCIVVLFVALATIVSHGQASVIVEDITGVGKAANGLNVNALLPNASGVTTRNSAIVEGCYAADDPLAVNCYPVLIGGNASTAVPSAMSADGDGVRAWFSRNGVQHVMNTAGTSTLANISGSATSVALIASNTARLFAKCYNDSTAILYVNYGATASATAFTEYVPPGATWTMDQPIYTGAINGMWASATGSARCTELTQ